MRNMEMEHINDNTIRVIIKNEDLEARGITLLDLMGNKKDIERFFYSILEEVDEKAEFQDSDSVTFQVLPNRNGLELLISKNLGLPEGFPFLDLDDEADEEDIQELQSLLKEKIEHEQAFKEASDEDLMDTTNQVFYVPNFEDLLALSDNVKIENGLSNLYVYEDKYYLELVYVDELTDYELNKNRALVLEYAQPSQYLGPYLQEHGKLLMKRTALELLSYYFNI